MKKIYNQPTTKIVKLHSISGIMLSMSGATKASSTAAVETHEDNSWDIWGTGDYED